MTMASQEQKDKEKLRRCGLAKCPELGAGNPKCAVCTGPVAVRVGGGWASGRARSCHGCAMNGLGLAVCWACCPGPNQSFITDGQSIVSADSAESPDGLVAQMAEGEWLERRTAMTDGRRTDMDNETSGDIEAALNAVRKAVRFPSREWERIRRLVVSSDAKDALLAADMIGIARSLLSRRESAASRIVRRLAEVGGRDWDILRSRILNANCSKAAAMTGVTKQAVSKRENALRARFEWYGRFVESVKDADRPFFVGKGVITPRKPDKPAGSVTADYKPGAPARARRGKNIKQRDDLSR